MVQIIVGGRPGENLNTGSDRYNGVMGAGAWWTDVYSRQVVPTSGKFKYLFVRLTGTPGASKSYKFSLMVNGVEQSLSVTISGTNTTGNDTSNEISVSAGDTVSLLSSPSGTPSAVAASWSLLWIPTIADETIWLANIPVTLGRNTFGCSQGSGTSIVAGNVRSPVPTSGTVKKMYVKLKFTPDGIWNFYVKKNGADQSITVNIPSGQTSGNDTSNTFTLSAGNDVCEYSDGAGTLEGRAAIGLVFVPDTSGQSVILGANGVNLEPSAARYASLIPNGNNTGWVTPEEFQLIQSCRLSNLYVQMAASPGTGKSYTYDLRIAGGDSGLTVTISGSNTTGNDTTNSKVVLNGDTCDMECTPSGTPAVTTAQWGVMITSVGSVGYARSFATFIG